MLTRPGGHYFPHIIMGDTEYTVMSEIQKCRSGRCAAIVHKSGSATTFDLQLIQKVLAQEFPNR